MKKALILIFIIIVLIISLVFSQRNTNESISKEQSNTVVTTIYPLYYITNAIAGSYIDVKRLIKPGSDLHSFSPTPEDMVTLMNSNLLITLGESMEPWINRIVTATNMNTLTVTDQLDIICLTAEHHHEVGDHHAHKPKSHNKGLDPHVWLNFENASRITEVIRKKLSQLFPKYSSQFQANASALQLKFKKLHQLYKGSLKLCKKDTILVAHDAFAYMEKEYGLHTESIIGVFAHSRPNASKIVKLRNIIKEKNLTYLFYDPLIFNKSASQLAKDMNLTLLPLYTLGNISLDDEKRGEDMMTLINLNFAQLKKGLECP